MKFLNLLSIFVLTGTIFFICQTASGQSGQIEKFSYISPVPGSKFINPENNIAFRHGDMLDMSSVRRSMITVTGSQRGEITGTVKLSLDGRTIIFTPDKPFSYNETIFVEVSEGIRTKSGVELEGMTFDFKVKEQDNTELLNEYYRSLDERHTIPDHDGSLNNSFNRDSDRNLPEDFPEITIMEFDKPSPGYTYYQSYYTSEGIYYLMVLDNYGIPIFYRKWNRTLRDFRKTAHDKMLHAQREREDATLNCYYVLDKWYNIIDTLLMGNGYYVDPHDAELFENGDRLMIAYDPQLYAMDTVVPGGDPNATVVGLIVQELDAADNVIFQWRSWDHYNITDAYEEYDLTRSSVDYAHGNAVERDTDGNIMISSRHMNEITKIDQNTAEIIWRFGLNAKKNMFTFDNDTNGFYYQHDINRIANGNITIHDNGNYHDPQYSQAVEYEIDETSMTAHLVWNYINYPDTYGRAQGSSQRLPDDNTLICWGNSFPIMVTETDYNKNKTWELSMEQDHRQYRAHKYNWITDMFVPNFDTIDFGVYDDYVPWIRIFTVTNNSDHDMEITSTHNHWDSYYVSTQLPLSIPAGETKNVTVNFFPTMQGQINDILTLNYDSFLADTLPQRIARQVHLKGYVEDENPPVATIDPADGSTGVSQEKIIKIKFDESVVKTNGSTLKSSDIPGMIEFKGNDISGEDVTYSAYINAWKTEIVITPDYLKPLQDYSIKLVGNNVADKSGNVLAENTQSLFTTADEEVPVVSILPEDEATDVSTLTIITIGFSEPVVKVDGGEITNDDLAEMILMKETDIEGNAVGFTATINEEKTEITIVPDSLKILQLYYVELIGNTVADEYGNVVTKSQTSTFTTADDTGIEEGPLNDLVKLFPNPTNGQLTLVCDIKGSKDIQVMNAIGKVIYEQENITDEVHQIDLGDQPEGIYIVKIILSESNQVFEIKTIKL